MWLERRLTTAAAAGLIQRPEAEARSRLQRLVEAGFVEARGERKGRSWHLSAATYRRLGDRSAYVRQRGFESVQQKQMVLQFAEKHGSISRAETADLCRLSGPQAYRLLKTLEQKGLLRRAGTRGRGVRYERNAR